MRAALLLFVALGVPEENPVGIWNLKSRDTTNRAVGGERVVLLKIEEVSGKLIAQITSIRHDFRVVREFSYEDGSMVVKYGAYVYRLDLDGDRASGTVESPLGKLEVEGSRQAGVLYGTDEPDPFYTTRRGIIGHRTAFVVPDDEADPVSWVKSRIDSVEDFALIVGRRHRAAIEFVNGSDFEVELLSHAGKWVLLSGTWVGEKIEIDKIEPTSPPRRR